MNCDQHHKSKDVIALLKKAGATECLYVGGYVRDCVLGIASKDIDIEVYGLGFDQIVAALAPHFRTDLVGKAFGIIKVDRSIDVSIPRRDNKVGVGHDDFEVQTDPNMSPHDAAARRDFTVNSLAMNLDGEIIDPFNGEDDLQHGILKATSGAFVEDPLRVLRGMQFASRFALKMDKETIEMSRSIKDQCQHLSKERIFAEWRKWAGGPFPCNGLDLLLQTEWVENFPELFAMVGCEQEPEWHPEGDVYAHTSWACYEAVKICERRGFTPEQREAVMFGVLCHDLGKPTTTETKYIEKADKDRIVSHRHAEAGRNLALAFMSSIKAPGPLRKIASRLTAEHMAHVSRRKDKLTPRMVRRLAYRLHPATIDMWAATCESDASGRPPMPMYNPVVEWEEMALGLAVQDSRPKPILMGRHLFDLGVEPGPEMGEILTRAFEAQLDGEFLDLDSAIEWWKESIR
jgi:tRNA nucleotidyltransferase (CCA-adding enzyme)